MPSLEELREKLREGNFKPEPLHPVGLSRDEVNSIVQWSASVLSPREHYLFIFKDRTAKKRMVVESEIVTGLLRLRNIAWLAKGLIADFQDALGRVLTEEEREAIRVSVGTAKQDMRNRKERNA